MTPSCSVRLRLTGQTIAGAAAPTGVVGAVAEGDDPPHDRVAQVHHIVATPARTLGSPAAKTLVRTRVSTGAAGWDPRRPRRHSHLPGWELPAGGTLSIPGDERTAKSRRRGPCFFVKQAPGASAPRISRPATGRTDYWQEDESMRTEVTVKVLGVFEPAAVAVPPDGTVVADRDADDDVVVPVVPTS
jgi:hypothetical protein